MLRFLIILSVIGASYATPTCQDLHKSQLASLTERMNQMLSSLYTPTSAKSAAETNTTPPAQASSPATSASEHASLPYPYYPYPPYSIPAPQVIYVSPNQYPPIPFTPPTAVDPNVKPFKAPQPFEFAQPGPMDVPWGNHVDHYYPYSQYPPPQYPPMPTPYPPLPYPPPYPYPAQPSVPSYQPPPQVYPPPPVPYLLPPHYH